MESYVTPILLSYVDKYVRDFKPADVQVSLWGGGVTLHNLVLKPDVLQREVALPFTLVSGRIHELLISVPWTKITSEPIEVTINTIECVLSLNPPNTGDENGQPQAARNQMVPSPPRGLRGLIRRVVSNISVTIQSLIVKYVQDDIVLSLNIKWLYIDSADSDWKPAFADIDEKDPVVRRLVRLDDFTLCLDRSDCDGRIRYYQEPLLDRCALDIRILTTLVSLQNRKAKNLSVQVRSDNLELGVTSDQLQFLLRLLRERPTAPHPQPPPNPAPAAGPVSTSTEAPKTETWSEWAWSWFPSWSERGGVGEAPAPAREFPILVSAFLNKVAFVLKGMETDASNGRRYARPLLELSAAHVVLSYLACAPTLLRVKAGVRALQLVSRGKCVCGYIDLNASQELPTPYLVTDNVMESNYIWPEEMLGSYTVETALLAEENEIDEFPEIEDTDEDDIINESDSEDEELNERYRRATENNRKVERDKTWFDMSPAIFLQIAHDRHTLPTVCPYENPPEDFEYSDWKEEQRIRVSVRPLTIHVSSGLRHRLQRLYELLKDIPAMSQSELVVPPLTVEECEALAENIPRRFIEFNIKRFGLRFTPWDHALNQLPAEPLATLHVGVDRAFGQITAPLYPRRVCFAACEIPDLESPIRQATYLEIHTDIQNVTAQISTPTSHQDRPLLEATIVYQGSFLLYKELFKERNTIYIQGNAHFPLITTYTTPPAVCVAAEVLRSLYNDNFSTLLKDTTLADDISREKDTIALECVVRISGIEFTVADNVKMGTLHAINIKMTAVELINGNEGNIGWVLSAPDYELNSMPSVKIRVHLCDDATRADALEYIAIETDSSAVNLDPLLVRWLVYRPYLKPKARSSSKIGSMKSMSSVKYFNRRRPTPPAATLRGSRGGSVTDFVHGRTRSAESISERPEQPPPPQPQLSKVSKLWEGEQLVRVYERLRRTLVSVDTGALLVYNTSSTASALGTATVHEAMERHATELHRVLVFSLGKWVVTTAAQGLWEYVNEGVPTYLPPRLRLDQSFPWKVKITGISSFTLESCPPSRMTDKDRALVRSRSQSRTVIDPEPRTLLDLLESTIIVSFVTKTVGSEFKPPPPRSKRPPPSKEDQRKKYFTGGMDYKPTTFREFVRGPGRRPGSPETHTERNPPDPSNPPDQPPEQQGDRQLLSLGLHIHGDTPPVNIHVTQDQIHTIRAAFHCVAHIIALLRRPNTPIPLPKSQLERPSSAPLIRPGGELRSSSEETSSENLSEQLIPIFQTRSAQDTSSQLRTLLWFQWVVNRASISFLTEDMKLTLLIEDSITTIDLQESYEQFRLKIASCTIYHFKQSDCGYGWMPGVLGGRVLETRETPDGKTINFFTCTVTRAHASSLPPTWKEEFITKPRRTNRKREDMLEVTVRTAPLEVMLHPHVLEALTLVGKTLVLTSFCPVPLEKSVTPFPMPYCHLNLGGVRLVVSAGEYDGVQDDTLIFYFGAIQSRPHPQNPICRRSLSALTEAGWGPTGNALDSRQHEIIVKGVGIRSSRIREMLNQMKAMRSRSERTVNPAANWAEPLPSVNYTPILHNVDLQGVFAPPLYSGVVLACGPAIEVNVPADVTIELSAEQLAMLARVLPALQRACTKREDSSPTTLDTPTWCPLSTLYVFDEDPDEDNGDETIAVSDSGIESQPSTSRMDPPPQPKKNSSDSSLIQNVNPWHQVEVFMMMGRIDMALYILDDPQSPIVHSLRPSDVLMPGALSVENTAVEEEHGNVTLVINTPEENGKKTEPESVLGSKSLTETVREADVGRSCLDILEEVQFARRQSKYLPILHATLSQPNLYYWRKMAVKGLRMSLFNLWVAHGEGQEEGAWHAPLLTTREGERDPDTEIPPSLATLHFDTLPGTSTDATRDTWSVKLDIDRPVSIDLYPESLRRLKIIATLVSCALTGDTTLKPLPKSETPHITTLYSLAAKKGIEQVHVRMCQMGVQTGGLSAGWESLEAQLACARRPERLSARVLITALLLTTHTPDEPPKQHVAVQPVSIGIQAEAAWEAWRSGESGAASEPTLRAAVELSDLAVDVRPADIAVLDAVLRSVTDVLIIEDLIKEQALYESTFNIVGESVASLEDSEESQEVEVVRPSPPRSIDSGTADVYYKDDLRSGAFKILSGEDARAPMAYEVALRASTVMWCYPVPRAITRLVAHPLPDCNEEVECVLESLNQVLNRWEQNAYFKIPVSESHEYRLTRTNSDKVFAKMWRVRLMPAEEKKVPPFEFHHEKYLPQENPVVNFGAFAEYEDADGSEIEEKEAAEGGVSAEQLAGALRVDSFLSPRLTPRRHLAVRCGTLALHLHNDLPQEQPSPELYNFEGVYVSPGQRRAHRVLSAISRNAIVNVTRSAGHHMLAFEGQLGMDLYESETGTMEPLVRDFRLQTVFSKAKKIRARVCAGDIRVCLNGPRVRTLTALVKDWMPVYEQSMKRAAEVEYSDPWWTDDRRRSDEPPATFRTERARLTAACGALEGRVYLFVENTCDVPVRLGQHGTDEIVTLMPNTTLAYRWNSPLAAKKLRFSIMNVAADWHWSNSVSFTEGAQKVRLEEPGEAATGFSQRNPNYLYVRVEDLGGRKHMILSGKVLLGNMLKDSLTYKVRVRDPASDAPDGMRTVSRGELLSESVGYTVLGANCQSDTYIKIKFSSQESGWTGDIPLKPCPKAHVPWLVKVPLTSGEVPCVSVWCRVERTRKDERVTVMFFPMFLMRSHLPLDVNVSMTTEPMEPDAEEDPNMPPLMQRAAGRGAVTQLLAHGTTTVKHTLIFKYRMAECQVTRESVPLHYGMVERSVFEQYTPPTSTENVAADALDWLTNGIGDNPWPYSVVRTHWPTPWRSACLQPRCEVMVRYEAVVCGGGGCGLVVHLVPRALLVNAADVAVTVRAADTAPLCRVDPGAVIALPPPVPEKPFYMTIQERHETYMSNELSVCDTDPGVYGSLRPGQLAVDRPTRFAIHCNDRVALMTIHYNMYREINVFGVTSTYLFINKLPFDLLIAPMMIESSPKTPPILRPDVYTRVKPARDGIMNGERITYFWLGGPWVDDLEGLRAFFCITMPKEGKGLTPAHPAVPVLVGVSAMRRSIALRNSSNESVPVVVTQVMHEGRWVVTAAADSCPQYIVRNMAGEHLAVAQPLRTSYNPATEDLLVLPEVVGCKWWSVLQPQQYSYYSTPTHLACGAPPPNDPDSPRAAYLVVGRVIGEMLPDWGNPFAVKEGEQLVQLPGDLNLKVNVHIYPHSTAVDLQPVDHGDLSASEIRRRLAHRYTLPDPEFPPLLDRLGPDNKLFEDFKDAHKRKLREIGLSGTSTSVNSRNEKEPEKVKSSEKLPETDMVGAAPLSDWVRVAAAGVTIELAHGYAHTPLVRAAAERVVLLLRNDGKNQQTMVSVGDVQVDNPQHVTRQFDFAVVASTSAVRQPPARFPPLWATLVDNEHFDARPRESNVVVRTTHVKWNVAGEGYGALPLATEHKELSDVDIYVGPISLYIEDEYVRRVSELARLVSPPAGGGDELVVAEALALYRPLRVHRLYVHPLDLTLTLHTAMRLYIGVDKSPLRMSAFKLENVVTTSDRLTHELTVHYLSGAILGAGWVVGGLELLGAPGSLAARLSSARGGVRDVAATAGAAVLRSVNSCAGSLARNLDLLAGDDDHTQRAAIARREIPPTLIAGLFAGMQNFAVNILGAVGGLAHHPVVGVAVGETSGAVALRRGLLGALAKPLSATADLVAYAGQGLLAQTGWDPDPEQRPQPPVRALSPWRRDNVRWAFRLQSLRVLYGVDAMLDDATVRLVVTDKFLVVAEPGTERIVEMVDFRFCKLVSYDTQNVELRVTQHGPRSDSRDMGGEENAFRVNSAAMARVARYTGARAASEGRALRLQTTRAGAGPALAAAVALAVRQNQPTHFCFL